MYMLRCSDQSIYVGSTRKELEPRVAEHNAGIFGGYTERRRPVTLIFSHHFESITDAIAAERQVKGWSRAKKEALAQGDWNRISLLAKRRGPHPSRRPLSAGSSG
jgi:putative endonuclease